jgi:hypothetical protein
VAAPTADKIREGREKLTRVHAALGVAAALDPDPIKGNAEVFGMASYTLRTPDCRVQSSSSVCLNQAVLLER